MDGRPSPESRDLEGPDPIRNAHWHRPVPRERRSQRGAPLLRRDPTLGPDTSGPRPRRRSGSDTGSGRWGDPPPSTSPSTSSPRFPVSSPLLLGDADRVSSESVVYVLCRFSSCSTSSSFFRGPSPGPLGGLGGYDPTPPPRPSGSVSPPTSGDRSRASTSRTGSSTAVGRESLVRGPSGLREGSVGLPSLPFLILHPPGQRPEAVGVRGTGRTE